MNFLDLPHELIDFILQNDVLNGKDICYISQTCTIINGICQSKELWRQKLQQRWPGLLQRYSRSQQYDWSSEFRKCYMVGQKVRSMVEKLSPTYYSCEEVSEEGFEDFIKLLDECNAGEIVLNSLMEIFHDQKSHCNLTNKFYAAKVLRNIQHHYLQKKWITHLDQHPNDQWLETGAILLSQWCQPTENIKENNVYDLLDKMTAQVIAKCPENIASVFKREKHERSWSTEQERTLLETLNSVLFEDYKLRGNSENYYDELNSYIHQVLSRGLGIPITLAIVYAVVARRLGVTCQLINFPQHLLLRWKEHPLATPNQQFTYIDAFNQGKFCTTEELPSAFGFPGNRFLSYEVFSRIDPIEVYRRMCRNLINIGRQQSNVLDSLLCLRNALDLAIILSPSDIDTLLLSVRVNLHLGIDLSRTSQMLEKIVELDASNAQLVNYLSIKVEEQGKAYKEKKNKEIIPKIRSDGKNKNLLFSVGLVMCHKRYNYMCVIYGWDYKCEASKEWIHQMGVHTLPNKQHQPFYNVLVEDGSCRYAAQENLTMPETVSPVSHPEVGKYFESFTGTHYVMNNEKSREYPEDGVATEQSILKTNH
ncbi:F-box only protein 21-like [Ylistrum balloti]|uniref:F-box only protein 21-like n=1 Tax=Ylistrum balloti TaxID=509963 RepID=UPI00290588DA|nr:F-box only protein 21-like [Ylistrum balloti]